MNQLPPECRLGGDSRASRTLNILSDWQSGLGNLMSVVTNRLLLIKRCSRPMEDKLIFTLEDHADCGLNECSLRGRSLEPYIWQAV